MTGTLVFMCNCLSCSPPLLLELNSRLMEDGVCSQH